MKRLLLSVFAAAAVVSMSADALLKAPVALRPASTQAAQAPSRAEAEVYNLKFYGEIYSAYTFQVANATYVNAIYITPEEASQLAGNVLDQISYAGSWSGVKNGTVFVSENLDADPVVSQSVRMSSTFNAEPFYKLVTLENPYTIQEGVGFYFGFTIAGVAASQEYVIPVDMGPAGSHAGYSYVYDSEGNLLEDANLGQEVNCNLAIFAHTTGSKKLTNVFLVGEPSFGDFTLPVISTAEGSPSAYLPITNYGGNEITSVDYSYSIAGGESVSKSIEISVAPESEDVVELPIEGEFPVGTTTVSVTINSINGITSNTTSTLKAFNLGEAPGFRRKMVVEEGTGTWCGWCPRGIYGMEYMEENHGEDFIGIAIHSGDEMAASTYNGLLTKFFEGFPSCIVNRDPIYNMDPNWQNFEFAYQLWSTQVSPVNITITDAVIDADGKNIKVTSETEFAIDMPKASYYVSYVLIQDNIPGVQKNQYAGTSMTDAGPWNTYPSSVPWYYDHTARGAYSWSGNRGSIPSTVVAGEKYEYSRNVSLTTVITKENEDPTKATGIDKTHLVAMVIDASTGIIMNACEFGAEDYTVGIADKVIDTPAVDVRGDKGAISISGEYKNAQVFTISGQAMGRTTGLVSGIYVVVVDGTAHKVVVK